MHKKQMEDGGKLKKCIVKQKNNIIINKLISYIR